jgi:type IV secretion system protein VirD4
VALVEQLAISGARAVVRPFQKVFLALLVVSVVWLWPVKAIFLRIDKHPSQRAIAVYNYAGSGVIWCAILYAGVVSPLLAISAPWRGRRKASRGTDKSDALGSASLGSPTRLRSAEGVIVGQDQGWLLRLPGEGHLITLARTGSGKGVSVVIPNLLTYPGSVLVTDPKGENVAVTARARRMLGQRVHILDPFGIAGGVDSFNPLDTIDASSVDAFDEATLLADMLVVPDGTSSEDAAHWTEEARALLTGLLLYVASHEPEAARTLTRVRQLLTADRTAFLATLSDMQRSDRANGLIAEAGNQLLQKSDKEQSGVISTAQRHTHFLSSPRMAAVLATSSVSFGGMKREPTTVYLVLPPQYLDAYRRWLRLMVGCALDAMVRTPNVPGDRVLLLFDEFPNLGRMQPIVRHMTLLRGYNARVWLLTQGLPQMRSRYPSDWETLIGSADVIQAFGISDVSTSEYLSKLSGDTTVRVTSSQSSHGTSRMPGETLASTQERFGTATSDRGRPLLFPDEVRRLDPARELLFLKADRPLIVDRVSYLTDAQLRELADRNPMHAVNTTG